MRHRILTASTLLLAVGFTLIGMLGAPTALASEKTSTHAVHAVPDILGCTSAPTPEVPGRGVVGFFESPPKTPPVAADPFVANSTTSIYEQYGYAGLRWNTYDLGCGPDLARSPDAAIGTAVANWIMAPFTRLSVGVMSHALMVLVVPANAVLLISAEK
jgi:hypothetical protein